MPVSHQRETVKREAVAIQQERPQTLRNQGLNGRYNTLIHLEHRPSTPRATSCNVQFAVGLCAVIIFIIFSVAARFRVLYKDDWDWVAPLLLHARLRDYLLLGGNEHIIIIPRALMWLDHRMNGLPGPLMWAIGLGSYLLSALALVAHGWRRSGLPSATARALAGVTLSLLFFTYQLQVFLLPAGITIPLATALAVGAMLAMIEACRDGTRGRAAWHLLSAGLALAAILTSGQGLAVPFALAAIVLAAPGQKLRSVLPGFVLGTALVLWLYARASGARTPSFDTESLALMTQFGLAFFAGPVAYLSVTAGVLIGATALAAGLFESFVVFRKGRAANDCQRFCVGLIAFVAITAALTAMARAHSGVAQASQSRYALHAMLYSSAVIALWTIRMSTSAAGQRRLRMTLAVTVVLSAAALPIDLFVGAVWWAKAQNARAAHLALRVGVPDFEWIRTLHPVPERPYEWSRAIQASAPMGSSPPSETTTRRCEGEMQLRSMEGGRFLRMSGPVTAPHDATIVLQDSGGTIRGLAEPAPLVDVPDPTYGQVIAAVGRAVRNGRFQDSEWFGFAQPGAGPPYRAFVIENATATCSVPVSVL